MHKAVDDMLRHYEKGRVSRRDLVAMLAALAAAPTLPAKAEATVLKAHSLNHASLIVSNVERSLKFYQDTFGMTVQSTGTGGANLKAGDQFLGVYQAGANARPEINHVCFGLRDFDPQRTVRALQAAGLKAEARDRDGVTQVYTADPDNLRIQLQDVSFCGGSGALGNVCR
jgi:catechol 2,3-dioxygenase-like lactoylglutathione lyase family enzyme